LLQSKFDIDTIQEEGIPGIHSLGGFFGSLLGGFISNQYGRKRAMQVSAQLIMIGSICFFFVWDYVLLLVPFFTIGTGIGISVAVIPVYISELVSPGDRGKLIALALSVMSTAYVMSGLYIAIVYHLFGVSVWRLTVGITSVPGLMFLLAMRNIPESPKFLMMKCEETQAKDILKEYRETDEDVSNEIEETKADMVITLTSDLDKTVFGILRNVPTRRALYIGCGLIVLTQCCGASTVIAYSSTILEEIGFGGAFYLIGFNLYCFLTFSKQAKTWENIIKESFEL